MTAPGARLLMTGSSAPALPFFFGGIGMDREFWAEDPDWADNPGDGNNVSVLRDNGSLAENLTASSRNGGALPVLQSSLINGLPGIDFGATSNTVGGFLSTNNGTSSSTLTVFCVARIDLFNASHPAPYIMDARNASVFAAIGGLNAAGTWTTYHTAGLNLNAGTRDTSDHLFVLVIKTNDYRFYVDGTLIGSDLSGTAVAAAGICLGADRATTASLLNGAISYAGHYHGDLTAHADYSEWETSAMSYYGL